MDPSTLSFTQRVNLFWKDDGNPIARNLLLLMDRKQTNLCLSVDVTTCAELLRLADLLGPQICVLKTHVDILTDFSEQFVHELVNLARKHDFLIFEDRKFADIGNTVRLQYTQGIYHISNWAHITNAHPVPGEGIIKGLKSGALETSQNGNTGERGLLLLAEMSSAGSLATGGYTDATIQMANRHRDFVFGFVAGRRLVAMPDYVYFSPGVQLESGGDDLGQQYRTPEIVVGECGSDVVIVGRGICMAHEPLKVAEIYRRRSWDAYLRRIKRNDI